MPQADISIIPSTVFSLFFSFLLGYFIWVNLIFPRLFTLARVRFLIRGVKEKSYAFNDESLTASRVENVSTKYFNGLIFTSLEPSLVLDVSSDEIPLIVNFFLIVIFFYFILLDVLKQSHTESQTFLSSLSTFDFAFSMKEANTLRLGSVKYLRKSYSLSAYGLLEKWFFARASLLLPLVVNRLYENSKSLLDDLFNAKSSKRNASLTKIFKRIQERSRKSALALLGRKIKFSNK